DPDEVRSNRIAHASDERINLTAHSNGAVLPSVPHSTPPQRLLLAGVMLKVFEDGSLLFGGEWGKAGLAHLSLHHRDLRLPHRGCHRSRVVCDMTGPASLDVKLARVAVLVGQLGAAASRDAESERDR